MVQQVVTGNRLNDGLVIFMGRDGGWTQVIDQAFVADTEEDAKRLEDLAQAAERARLVVGPYLIEVARNEDFLMPLRYRERIRAFGPSIHPEFGRRDVPGHFREGGGPPEAYMPTGAVGRRAAAMGI